MKIFYICYADMGGHNGAIRHIVEIAFHLHKLGHQVQLCAPGINKFRESIPIDIKYIPVVNLSILRPLVYILVAPIFLIIYLSRFKPDVIYAREIFLSFCQEAIILRLLNYPSVIEVNGVVFEQLNLPNIFSCLKAIIRLMQKVNLRLFDKIVVHSKGLKQGIERLYSIESSKLIVVPMGVNIENFRPQPKDEVRKKLRLPFERYYIGFVGGFMPWQGIDDLIESSPFIIREIPEATFLLVGGGRLKNSFIRRVRELGLERNFIFAGEVSFEVVPLYINAFDIGVVFFKPIRRDPGDPIKLYEYLACGIPIVASDIKGYGDVIEKIGAGKAVDSSCAQAVSKAVVDLLKDKRMRDRMAQRGGVASVKDYTWMNRARQIEDCLNEIWRV